MSALPLKVDSPKLPVNVGLCQPDVRAIGRAGSGGANSDMPQLHRRECYGCADTAPSNLER